jgi:hypothetical protein
MMGGPNVNIQNILFRSCEVHSEQQNATSSATFSFAYSGLPLLPKHDFQLWPELYLRLFA